MSNEELLESVCIGALAGFTATVPMSAFMLGTYKMLPEEEQYALQPRLITERLAEKADVKMPEHEARANLVSSAMHFGYGSGVGAIYPLVAASSSLNPLVSGAMYGLAVYATSYLGWLPATGVMSFGLKHPRRRLQMIVGAHLVWGMALGAVYAGLMRRRR